MASIPLEVVENGRNMSICADLHRMAGRKNMKFRQNLKKWLWKKKKARQGQKNKDQPGLS